MPSLPMLLAALHRANLVPDGMGGAAVCADARKCFYVVNPSGDLAHTQATFEAAFRLQPWEGVAGAPPDAQRLLAALRSQDLFAYCGHGAGERYLGGEGGESLRASPLAVSTAAILIRARTLTCFTFGWQMGLPAQCEVECAEQPCVVVH